MLTVYGYVYLDLCSADGTSWAEAVSLRLTKHKAWKWSWRPFLRSWVCYLRLGTTSSWSWHFGSGHGEHLLASDCKMPCSHSLHRQKRGEETDGEAVCPRPHRRSAGEARVEQTPLCPTTMIHLLSPLPGRALLRISIFKVQAKLHLFPPLPPLCE